MTILDFRIIVSFIMLLIIAISMIIFFLRKRPILKMINLAFVYILIMAFFVYIITIKQAEEILFPICIIIFISFVLTFLTGVGIVDNLLNNRNDKNGFN